MKNDTIGIHFTTADGLTITGLKNPKFNENRFIEKTMSGTDVMYRYRHYLNMKERNEAEEQLRDYDQFLFKYCLVKTYLRPSFTLHVDNAFFSPHAYKDTSSSSDDFLKAVQALQKLRSRDEYDGGDMLFRITSDEVTMGILFSEGKKLRINEDNYCGIIVWKLYNRFRVCEMRHYLVTIDDRTYVYLSSPPMVFSRKPQEAKRFADFAGLGSSVHIPPEELSMMTAAINLIAIKHDESTDIKYDGLYSSFERSIVARFMRKDFIDKSDVTMKTLNYWQYNDISPDSFNKIFGEYVNFNEFDDQIPSIAFGKKEWKFVDKYAVSKFFIDEGETVVNVPVNMREILMDQRYGLSLRFTYEHSESNKRYDILVTCKYHQQSDICRVTLICENWKTFTPVAMIDYNNVSKFKIKDSLSATRIVAYVDPDNLPSSMNELAADMPEIFMDVVELSRIVWDAFAVYLVIHDRPQRHRVVREERTTTVTRHPNSKNSSKTTDKVITRILMPFREAKEYVAKMSTGEHRDREYVIESWPRKGHWRRLPHSEEKIYIEKTTCKRHKALTEKEVVIKL